MAAQRENLLPDWGATNILNLPNPEEYTCFIDSYRSSHPTMKIVLKHERAILRLIFFVPVYFHGPFTWRGAQVNVGTELECVELLTRSYIREEGYEIDKWLHHYRFYKIPVTINDPDNFTVQLIAMGKIQIYA